MRALRPGISREPSALIEKTALRALLSPLAEIVMCLFDSEVATSEQAARRAGLATSVQKCVKADVRLDKPS
jgi:hypothetical protein